MWRLGHLLAGEEVWQAAGALQARGEASLETEALGVGELGDGVRTVLAPTVPRPLLGTQLAPVVAQLGVGTCNTTSHS